MADEQAKKPDAPAAPPEKKGGGGAMGIVMMVVTAALAGGAAFGGATMAGGHASAAPAEEEGEKAEGPGPTIDLEPFVVTLFDEKNRPHAMRVTLAVELKPAAVVEESDKFVPRIRDSALTYLRGVTFAKATQPDIHESLRTDLLARFKETGVEDATQVLITEFVVQ